MPHLPSRYLEAVPDNAPCTRHELPRQVDEPVRLLRRTGPGGCPRIWASDEPRDAPRPHAGRFPGVPRGTASAAAAVSRSIPPRNDQPLDLRHRLGIGDARSTARHRGPPSFQVPPAHRLPARSQAPPLPNRSTEEVPDEWMGAACGSKLGAKHAIERRRAALNRSEQTYADPPESCSRRSAHFLIYIDTVVLIMTPQIRYGHHEICCAGLAPRRSAAGSGPVP